MSDPFKLHRPAAMSYEAGDFANSSYKHKSGVVLKKKFGNQLRGRTLSVTYRLADNIANQFYKHYNDNLGTFGEFTLPSNFQGIFNSFCGTVLNDDKTKRAVFSRETKWRYAKPIEIRTFVRGFCELSIVLTDAAERFDEMPFTPV